MLPPRWSYGLRSTVTLRCVGGSCLPTLLHNIGPLQESSSLGLPDPLQMQSILCSETSKPLTNLCCATSQNTQRPVSNSATFLIRFSSVKCGTVLFCFVLFCFPSWKYLLQFANKKINLTFWRRNFFQILSHPVLAHPVFKMWVIQKPNKVALWNKRHFEEKRNGDYTARLKYSVRIFVE